MNKYAQYVWAVCAGMAAGAVLLFVGIMVLAFAATSPLPCGDPLADLPTSTATFEPTWTPTLTPEPTTTATVVPIWTPAVTLVPAPTLTAIVVPTPTPGCECEYDKYNCSDGPLVAFCFFQCGGVNNDIHDLDRDHDNVPCESN